MKLSLIIVTDLKEKEKVSEDSVPVKTAEIGTLLSQL